MIGFYNYTVILTYMSCIGYIGHDLFYMDILS